MDSIININLPASKSISHRVLILKDLFLKNLHIVNLSNSNDTILLEKYILNHHETIDFEDAGTPLRFFISLLSVKGGDNIVTANKMLQQRPIKDLLIALENLGAKFEYMKNEYSLPLKVIKKVDFSQSEVYCNGTQSSQFISSLMLIAPAFENGLSIHFDNEISSFSYINMTFEIMKSLGFKIEILENKIRINKYIENKDILNYKVENDWSSASFFISYFSKIRNKKLKFENLYLNSTQGDSVVLDYLKTFGLTYYFEDSNLYCQFDNNNSNFIDTLDLKNCLDLFPILCTTFFIHQKQIKFNNIKNLIYKESNRIESVRENLKLWGGDLIQTNDNTLELKILNSKNEKNKLVKSFNDHRIVMSFYFFKLFENIQFDNVICVKKSFPNFIKEFEKLEINHS